MSGISVRLSEVEKDYLSKLCEAERLSKTELIKKAIVFYGNNRNREQPKDIKAEAIKAVTKPNRIADFQHALLTKIQTVGLKPVDQEGNIIAEISSLSDLLDFVQKKVFRNGEG